MLKAGTFYHDAKSGAIVFVVRGGEGKLQTEHGSLKPIRLEMADESLELIDADLMDTMAKVSKDLGPRLK